MTVFNIGADNAGVWFDMEDGGRVQLRTLTADALRTIRKQTVKKKVDFKKIEGTPVRLEYDEINEDLQTELFWDFIIVAWENFVDSNGAAIECTKENKVLLMTKSPMFSRFVGDSLRALSETDINQSAVTEKN